MSILFTPFQVSQIPASAPQSRALEVYKKTVLPEMPQRIRAHRAARRVRDGVTVRPFRLPEPSLHLPTHCSPLPHAYLLFPFRRCLQTSLCVGGNSGSTANSKQHNFRGERRQAPPPRSRSGDRLQKCFPSRREQAFAAFAPQRGGVNEGLCAASPTVCSRCLLAETWQGSTLVFILTQSLRLFTPAQGPVRVVIQRSVRG